MAARWFPEEGDINVNAIHESLKLPARELDTISRPGRLTLSDGGRRSFGNHPLSKSQGEHTIFQALLAYPDVLLEFTAQLDIDSLVALYSMSKTFHDLLNARFVSMIVSHAAANAPEASAIFPFIAYHYLCQRDPVGKKDAVARFWSRGIPGFRWLRMVVHRERVTREIIDLLAREGHQLPLAASKTIKKIWLLMDLADNPRRIGLVHNERFMTDEDLYMATMFFIKLDMRFMDPIGGIGEKTLRKMFLAQRSLAALWNCLRGATFKNHLDAIRMYVRWNYEPSDSYAGGPVFGVPAEEIGQMSIEGWGTGMQDMLHPDELVMREVVRRELDLHCRYREMLLFGWLETAD